MKDGGSRMEGINYHNRGTDTVEHLVCCSNKIFINNPIINNIQIVPFATMLCCFQANVDMTQPKTMIGWFWGSSHYD